MALKKTAPAKEVQTLDDGFADYTIDMLGTLIGQSRSAHQPMLTYLLSMALIEAYRLSAETPRSSDNAALAVD